MPHCVLEYSPQIKFKGDFKSFFKELHSYMVSTDHFEERSIKSRVRISEEVFMGNGDPSQGFVFLQISLLSGRPQEILKELSSKALTILNSHLDKSDSDNYISVTVEIREMGASLHSKLE